MKTNFIIMAFVATSMTNAIQLKFTPFESSESSVLSETMKSLKESEQITGAKMEAPSKV